MAWHVAFIHFFYSSRVKDFCKFLFFAFFASEYSIFQNHWCHGSWPPSCTSFNIATLEFFPIVLSLFLWGKHVANCCILFFADNESLAHIINKQSCKDQLLIKFFVQKLVLSCLCYKISSKAKHLQGTQNHLADSLFRL